MLFMVQVQLHPGTKDSVLETFELRGPNRNPGISYRGAWIGAHDDTVFVLVEGEDEALVEQAAASWGDVGPHETHLVIDVEDY